MRIIKLLMFFLVLFVGYQAHALTAIPTYSQRVIDTTGTLTATQITQLERKLIDYEVAKGDNSQIAVLIIATLAGESIEQYATRVFEQWKIGQKGLDNGILLIVDKDERQVRIEVGYGLEGDLPDLKTKSIIEQNIIPAFRENNYYQGIDSALSVMMSTLNHTEQNDLNSVQQISSLKQIFNTDFGSVLLHYAGISFMICFFVGRLLPFSVLKKSVGKRSLVTGLINAISTSGFTFLHGFSFAIVLPILFLTFVVSTILCGIFSISKSSGGGSYRGPRGGSGSGFGGSRGGFGGGGGGRSGGGGASGRW